MRRRAFLQLGTTGFAALAAPSIARADETWVLKFIPQADLAAVDPMWTTSYVTRNHGYMVYDTLYGLNENYAPQPQMVEGHTVANDGKLWTLTLRERLKFHDNTPVLARDAVASIRRWQQRDPFGQALMAATDELSAPSDRVIQFRLKRPFPLLPNALGKAPSSMPCIMAERHANTDPMKAVTEVVGSGPFRFVADERVQGSRFVYEKFAGYVPRPGTTSFTAGPKIAHFDRVEWHVIPDAATAAAALQSGEMDWWEQPTVDLQPMLRKSRNVVVEVIDPTGVIGTMRFNSLQPPFDNPDIRRALLGAVKQDDFMTAIVGDDTALWHDHVGFFCPASPMATQAGIEVLSGPRNLDAVKKRLAAAGYRGEKVVLLGATDFPSINAESLVGASLLKNLGMNVDYQSMDWGTVTQRRTNTGGTDKGGWSAFFTAAAGLEMFDPTGHNQLRGNGKNAWFGWPTSPKLEQLRDSWFAAGSIADQKKICEQMQLQAFQDVPYIPLGEFLQATAYKRSVTGIPKGGFALFYQVRKS
jgi:peptide/nickel transport system substrate-binding protein